MMERDIKQTSADLKIQGSYYHSQSAIFTSAS